jgi:hypothetical protein
MWNASVVISSRTACGEERTFRGSPPQCRQREIYGIALFAEPDALVCERLVDLVVDVAQHRQ